MTGMGADRSGEVMTVKGMAVLYHQVWIEAPTAKVYEAISTEGVLEVNPGPEHGVLKARVLETVQDRWVEWEFISTHPPHSPASAWTGTHVVFEIARRAVPPWATERVDTAVLDFRHSGWDERSEYLGCCNFHRGEALQKLKRWCESP